MLLLARHILGQAREAIVACLCIQEEWNAVALKATPKKFSLLSLVETSKSLGDTWKIGALIDQSIKGQCVSGKM